MINISLVSTLQPFDSGSTREQRPRNAMFSWSLVPGLQVFIAGADDGNAQQCSDSFGFSRDEQIQRAYDIGYFSKAPLTVAMLRRAIELQDAEWFALINSDIVLLPDFIERLDAVINEVPQDLRERTFITLRRRDYQGGKRFSSESDILELEQSGQARLHPITGSDVFIACDGFWRELLATMPPFIHGKFSWDVWLHHYAVVHARMAIDASNSIHCYHAMHGSIVDHTNPEIYHNLMLYEALLGGEIFMLNDPRWVQK